jgi:hypothetical protein
MAGSLPARLTPSQGRRFGLTVGLAFVALSAFAWWRGGTIARNLLLALGGLLIAAGLLIPSRLGPVERAWMRMAIAISKVTTPIFMGIVYFGVITPTGVLRRALGRNALLRREGAPGLASGGFWVERPAESRKSDLERQY